MLDVFFSSGFLELCVQRILDFVDHRIFEVLLHLYDSLAMHLVFLNVFGIQCVLLEFKHRLFMLLSIHK